MSLKLAIWDMDGTIVDSREVISTSMVRAFQAVGLIPPTYDETRQIVGLALEEACRRLAPERTSEETLAHLVEAYRQAFIARRTEEDFREPLYDGAVETLERLANDNWLIAMATGKSRRGIDAIFSMHPLAQSFDTIHCADDGPGKPHPAMCLEAMKKMGAEPHESLMIGDAVFDMQMGRAAGLHSLGVTWGFGTRAELEAAGAHHISEKYDELNLELDRFAADLHRGA